MKSKAKVFLVCFIMLIVLLVMTACNQDNIEDIAAEDIELVYDGAEHGFILEGFLKDLLEDDELTFSDKAGGSYREEAYTFKDAGEHIVYFKVKRKMHRPYYGSYVVKISPRPITITPNALEKSEGQDDPELTFTYQGNVTGQTPAFVGELVRDTGEHIGSYEIKQGTLALADNQAFKASNYTFVFSDTQVNFTIKESLKISFDNAQVILNQNTFIYNGLQHKPAIQSVMIDSATVDLEHYTVSYSNNINAGTATVIITGQGVYIGSLQAEFTIERAVLTVTPNALSKYENQDDPTLSFEYSGNLAGQEPGFAGALTREAGETTGIYGIKIGSLQLKDNNGAFLASNYSLQLSTTTVNFTIKPLEQITGVFGVNNTGYTWDGSNAPSNITIGGTQSGDTIQYSKDASNWSTSQSSVTFNTPGAHTVYYKVSRANHNDFNGEAYMLIEEASLVTDFENQQMPSIFVATREGGAWTDNASKISFVQHNGSTMATTTFSIGSSGMNGILFNLYNNIPSGAEYIAIDVYTNCTLTFKDQHFAYTNNRGQYQQTYIDSQDRSERMSHTVYVSLWQVNSTYIWQSITFNVSVGSGTIYYDNLRFTKAIDISVVAPSTAILPPDVIHPAVDSIQSDSTLDFVWKAVPNTVSYNLYLFNQGRAKGLINSYIGITGTSKSVSLSGIGNQKVYWIMTSVSASDQVSEIREGYFNRVTQAYPQLGPTCFQSGDIGNIQWRYLTGGSWTNVTSNDLIEITPGDTVYQSPTCTGTQLVGVRHNFSAGSFGDNNTIAFTLSTDAFGAYKYRVWVYTSDGNNAELTASVGVSVMLSKTAQTFYVNAGGASNKSSITGYAVQMMGNEAPVYYHSMGLVQLPTGGAPANTEPVINAPMFAPMREPPIGIDIDLWAEDMD